jgi:hypothetical protein
MVVVRRQQRGTAGEATLADRRSFVQDTLRFLHEADAHYTTLARSNPDSSHFSDASVRRALAGFQQVMSRQGLMVLDQLGGETALFQPLREAYSKAVGALLSGAARLAQRSAEDLYETYRDLIFEWAIPAQRVAGITTPLPLTAHADARTHVATLGVGRVRFEFVPDVQMSARESRRLRRAETSLHFAFGGVTFRHQAGHITSFTPPQEPVLRVQTRYPRGWSPQDRSGYGRGTTREDVAAGETSLGFHESQHGADYLRFLREHPAPEFEGRIGMTIAEFRVAINAYKNAFRAYQAALEDYSLQSTDCVGTTIDDFDGVRGHRQVRCRT